MSLELLAPAGSIEGLKAVVSAGADAVYIGGPQFGARAYADNPGEAELVSGIEYAHLRGAKVYLTVNTLLKDDEIAALPEYIKPFYEAGVDAVLVQDFGVLRLLHRDFPDLPLHASTQMTVTGPEWALMLKKYGVTRIVPARELSLTELHRLKEESGLEVEVFVHGALCVCYSGQCLYSSMIGGRSGNRGRCAQPCRLLYLKNEDLAPGTSIVDNPRARHFLSPKDLSAAGEIAMLRDAGADSLKIEGRMKRPEYAAGVTSIYRKYVDLAEKGKDTRVTAEDQQKLYDLYNRSGFTDGYFLHHNGPDMMAMVKHELTQKETEARHSLLGEMHAKYIDAEKRVPVRCRLTFRAGQPAALTYHTVEKRGVPKKMRGNFPGPEANPAQYTIFSDVPADQARNRPLDAARLMEIMRKTGDTDFTVIECDIDTDEAAFMAVGKLNELRRACLAGLREKILSRTRRGDPEIYAKILREEHTDQRIGASGSTDDSADGYRTEAVTQVSAFGREKQPQTSGAVLKPAVTRQFTGKSAGEEKRQNAKQWDGDISRDHSSHMTLTAFGTTRAQLEAIRKEPSVHRVVAEAALFMYETDPAGAAAEFIRAAERAGKESGIVFPFISREMEDGLKTRSADVLRENVPELISEGLSCIYVRSTEDLAFFLRTGLESYLIADEGIYTMNRESQMFLREFGIMRDTAPYELNEKELFARNNQFSELVVYGRLPLMVMAQCVRKNTEKCLCPPGREPAGAERTIDTADPIVLTDREGMKFKVKNECCFCYNIVYNSVPLYLLDEMKAIRRMGFASARLSFTDENAETTGMILRTAGRALSGEKVMPDGARTKGHFKRGVE